MPCYSLLEAVQITFPVSQHTSEIMLLSCDMDKRHSAEGMSGLGPSLAPLGFVPSQFLYL